MVRAAASRLARPQRLRQTDRAFQTMARAVPIALPCPPRGFPDANVAMVSASISRSCSSRSRSSNGEDGNCPGLQHITTEAIDPHMAPIGGVTVPIRGFHIANMGNRRAREIQGAVMASKFHHIGIMRFQPKAYTGVTTAGESGGSTAPP